jgi:putative phosphoribosyl transferase
MSVAVEKPLVLIAAAGATLVGLLEAPAHASSIVVFSHGSGSSLHSPRNLLLAGELRRAGFATLLLELLTPQEDEDREARFDIGLLSRRLGDTVRWLDARFPKRGLGIGMFGADTGAASALRMAAEMPYAVRAVVCRSGRPDLAGGDALARVRAPTLLVVGGEDRELMGVNYAARDVMLDCTREVIVVPGATHLFEEPGALEQVARHAADWFTRHLR